MTTLIRRDRQRRRPFGALLLGAGAALVVCGGVLGLAWHRGGPEPMHQIDIMLPATQVGE